MCVVSMVGDHYNDKWKDNDLIKKMQQPYTWPSTGTPLNPYPYTQPNAAPNQLQQPITGPSKFEFEQLRKEVLEMKELLKRAVEYDKKNNEPHCEIEEKMATLKSVAKLFGVNLDDVLKQ